MKNIIKITIVASLFLVWSCEGFLDTVPQDGSVTDFQFFQTEEDFDSYIFGAYAEYTGFINNSGIVMSLFMGGEIMQDIVYSDQSTKDLVQYMSPSNVEYRRHWKTNYTVLSRSNLILEVLDNAPISDDYKKIIEAEAKFLRGFAYYHLASAYGAVPLITEKYNISQDHMTCSPEKDIWALVISDLTYASANLPEKGEGEGTWGAENLGRAPKGAAFAFLAVAYMNTKEWAKAEKATTDLIALGNYNLLPDVRQVFNPDVPNSDESLFEIQMRFIPDGIFDWESGPTNGTTLPINTAPSSIGFEWAPGGGWGGFSANRKLADSFDPTDERRTKLMVIPGEEYKGLRMTDTLLVPLKDRWNKSAWTTKYWVGTNPNGVSYGSDNNIIAMRYAEVLLNYAEILFENGKSDLAYDELNKVRVRAKLTPLTSSTDKAVFMTALMKERRWELNFEPNLWYHFMRTETAADYYLNEQGITMNAAWLNWPIPQPEIDLNPNLCQNDGY